MNNMKSTEYMGAFSHSLHSIMFPMQTNIYYLFKESMVENELTLVGKPTQITSSSGLMSGLDSFSI